MKLKATLIGAVIGCSIASSASAACSTSDVRVKSWNWHVEHGYAIYVGEIVNGCAEATGVQLQIVSRSASGEAVDSEQFWPASTNNIPAGGSYVFKWTAEANRQAKNATLGVIAVNQW
jgi:hypothetical protein